MFRAVQLRSVSTPLHSSLPFVAGVSRLERCQVPSNRIRGLSTTGTALPQSHQQRYSSTSGRNMSAGRIQNPVLFICDIQDKFRSAIWEFPKVIATSQKMIKAASILNMPIYATTQNAARLGATVSELSDLINSHNAFHTEIDKTAFSMMTPQLKTALLEQSAKSSGPHVPLSVILVGIESHICVSQTTLDLLAMGHRVYVLADGVSSCNAGERPVALARLRQEGAIITTSESLLFELVGDAVSKEFKAIAGLVKETKDDTKTAVETFCKL